MTTTSDVPAQHPAYIGDRRPKAYTCDMPPSKTINRYGDGDSDERMVHGPTDRNCVSRYRTMATQLGLGGDEVTKCGWLIVVVA
jgi:hypothetical protein